MRNKQPEDKLVVPPPPVIRHSSEESHQTVVALLRGEYDKAAAYVQQEAAAAEQARRAIAELNHQLAEAERRLREHEINIQRGQNLMTDLAAHLAAAGEQVPGAPQPVDPLAGAPDLSPNADGAMQRFEEAHAELAREESVR